MLQALERQQVTFIVIGALGRVIHGSGELTDGIDVVPATNERTSATSRSRSTNSMPADRMAIQSASSEISPARPSSNSKPTQASSRSSPNRRAPAATATSAGAPTASRSAMAFRPSVASIHDHARMLAALDRPQDRTPLLTLRRVIELEELVHG